MTIEELRELRDWLVGMHARLDRLEAAVGGIGLCCGECGRNWADPSERWRSVLAVDDNDSMEPGEAHLFCPECSEAEFSR